MKMITRNSKDALNLMVFFFQRESKFFFFLIEHIFRAVGFSEIRRQTNRHQNWWTLQHNVGLKLSNRLYCEVEFSSNTAGLKTFPCQLQMLFIALRMTIIWFIWNFLHTWIYTRTECIINNSSTGINGHT